MREAADGELESDAIDAREQFGRALIEALAECSRARVGEEVLERIVVGV